MSNVEHAGRRLSDHESVAPGRRATDTVNTWLTVGNNAWKLLAGFIGAVGWTVAIYFGLKQDNATLRAYSDQNFATKTEVADVLQPLAENVQELLILTTKNSTRLENIEKKLDK